MTVDQYVAAQSPERQEVLEKLRALMKKNLPKGFEETIGYGMIAYVVPHKLYPAGYHCDPKIPLPFISIASQKNFIALYHMGMYAMPDVLKWFEEEYSKAVPSKLDMGKSCVRFKKLDQIPYDLLADLAKKTSVKDWIACYEKAFVK